MNARGQAPVPLASQRAGFVGHIAATTAEASWRIRELGFIAGTRVAVLRQGPLGDPLEVELRGYRICLRRSDLEAILVQPDGEG